MLAAEIIRLNRAISDMKQKDVQLMSDLKKLSQQLQAAMHQRNLLTNAERERQKKAAPKQRPWSRRPDSSGTQPSPPPVQTVPPQTRRPTGPRQRIEPLDDGAPPEASPRLIQNVMLALGPLLLAITAVIFALIDLETSVNPAARLTVLGVVTVALLLAPPVLVKRGLSSTAESLAVVGLTLLPIDGYVLAQLEVFKRGGASDATKAGLIFAGTTAIAFLFHQATALTSARYAMVLASQPVLPLLAYDHVHSPAGWALVLAILAAQNALIARALELYHGPTPTPTNRSTHWLWEMTWVLHGLAIGAAAVYALDALLTAKDVPSTSRAALTLLLVSLVGLLGALMLRRRPLGDVAAGALTLAVIGSAARVAVVAIPDRAALVVASVVFGTGLAVRALPHMSRRGPQLASALAVAVVSAFVVFDAVRAAIAPVRAAMPMWRADLDNYQSKLALVDSSWQLVVTIGLLAAAAALALPPAFRRESGVAGALLTGLAAPVSLGLSWQASIWVLTSLAIALLAIGIGVGSFQFGQSQGWAVTTNHAATAHMIASVTAGVAALGVALARPWSTAGVLVAFTVAGIMLAAAQKSQPAAPAETIKLGDTATGAAAFAAPGAVCTGLLTLVPGLPTPAALTAGFLAASVTLAMVAVRLVAHRRIGTPLAIGTGLGALVITGAAFGVDDAGTLDAGVGALLLVAAILLTLAPSIDEGLRADRLLDGADIAAAAVTTAAIASLARAAELFSPDLWLAMSAAAVLVVALGIRMLPEEWRRGPAAGAGISGAALGIVAGYPALAGGIRAITTPGELWAADLTLRQPVLPFGWQAPAALILLAIAAMVALPRPRNYDAAAAAVVLATIGTPAALGWPWWASIVLGLAIATCYAVAATIAVDARAGYARLTVAVIVALHSLTASLVLLWTTAAALAVIALVSASAAGLAAAIARMSIVEGGTPPSHLDVVGGTGVLAALLAGPGAVAAYFASVGSQVDATYTATIIAIGGGLAILAFWRRAMAPYLGWATVGVAVSSTLVAVFALATGRPAGVYGAAAVLLVVLAELLRGSVRPLLRDRPARERVATLGARRWRVVTDQERRRRWPSHPGTMAAAGATAPALIAIGSLAPALRAALVTPYDRLNAIWQGPPPPLDFAVDQAGVLTALLLTFSGALAAIGFGGGLTRAVSVVVPGIALTIMITPVSLGMEWPASVMAGLTVFTVCMLSVALTVPPIEDDSTSGIRAARVAVLIIGLIGGGAGLVGSLATPGMTIFTFAGAVGVGLVAAFGGRTQRARILGWLGGAVAAELLVLSISLRVGAKPEWAAYAVLAVGTGLIAAAALLPRFTRPESIPEASAMEWAGYTAGVIALALAVESPAHVAGLLAGFGAVLGMTATRPGRSAQQKRVLFWAAAGSEIAAWWLILRSNDVAFDLIEVYTVPFAALALAVGLVELRQRPQLGSWAAYGPALIAGFGPTIVMALANEGPWWREVLLLLTGTAVLIFGSQRQQRAPVTIGSIVLTITAFHALTLVDWTWLAVGITGLVLVILGASSERRRRAVDRYNRFR
ncbi:MAG TPA: permease [Micromonosporaceae bacterium]|nr:permease [Micromonosporaceae bacterium]